MRQKGARFVLLAHPRLFLFMSLPTPFWPASRIIRHLLLSDCSRSLVTPYPIWMAAIPEVAQNVRIRFSI